MTVEYVQDYLNRYIGCKQASDEFCSLSGGCKNCEYNRDTVNSEKVLQMMIVIRDALEREMRQAAKNVCIKYLRITAYRASCANGTAVITGRKNIEDD